MIETVEPASDGTDKLLSTTGGEKNEGGLGKAEGTPWLLNGLGANLAEPCKKTAIEMPLYMCNIMLGPVREANMLLPQRLDPFSEKETSEPWIEPLPIADAAKDKRIEGISDIRDESSRLGVRVVIELKRDATPDVVLNQLWRHTPAQSSFPANMLAIRGGRPELLNLRDIIESFVRFHEQVITRRTKYELAKARERAHILLGLVIAVSNLDEVVRMIRASSSPAAAREALMARAWPIADIAPLSTVSCSRNDPSSGGLKRKLRAPPRSVAV